MCSTVSLHKICLLFTESSPDENSSASLLCVQCKDAFNNAWDLMVHAQAAHMLNIYELGVPAIGNCSSPSMSPRDNNTPDKVRVNVIKCLQWCFRFITRFRRTCANITNYPEYVRMKGTYMFKQ